MPFFITAFVVAVIGIAIVSNQPDNGACLVAHSETYTQTDTTWMQVGEVWIPLSNSYETQRTVCDRWEFPDGRPAR